jgi:hypothetical protein
LPITIEGPNDSYVLLILRDTVSSEQVSATRQHRHAYGKCTKVPCFNNPEEKLKDGGKEDRKQKVETKK